jgi:hypothetical protein
LPTFDTSFLSLLGVTYGDPVLGDQLDLFGFGSLALTTPGAGTVNLFQLSFDLIDDLNTLQASSFVLAQLTFNTLSPGSTGLTVSLNSLSDAAGSALDTTATGGMLSIRPPVTSAVPEPSTSWLMLVGGAIAAARARRAARQPV